MKIKQLVFELKTLETARDPGKKMEYVMQVESAIYAAKQLIKAKLAEMEAEAMIRYSRLKYLRVCYQVKKCYDRYELKKDNRIYALTGRAV